MSDSRSVPAFCKSDCWLPRYDPSGIVCASGACCTCAVGETDEEDEDEDDDEEHEEQDVGFGGGQAEWEKGRKEGGDQFGTLQGTHVWFMAFHPRWLPSLRSNKDQTSN